MKLTILDGNRPWAVFTVASGLLLLSAGCGPNAAQDPNAAARQQEIERLQAENQALAQVRAENEEVQRLKQENEDLPKLRSQYQEAARLKKENEQLRQQIAKAKPAGAGKVAVNPIEPPTPAAQLGASENQTNQEPVLAEGTIQEEDDILVEPRYLKELLPDIDWEKLNRTEPISIRTILERDGLRVTNMSQLRELGLTNFVIRHAPRPAPAPAAAPDEAR